MTDFASRRAIVTGGAHGIGASIVRRLRSAGAAGSREEAVGNSGKIGRELVPRNALRTS
jgi:NAD(P)-dependent dehydrogenase (short-subunit alcohol dehydrogenase family)